MTDPIIAIVGSADPTRTDYDPPLRNQPLATKAAEDLGWELAEQGFRIMVYSAIASFIENDVVRGYAKNPKAKDNSIVIRYPAGQEAATTFPERQTRNQLFSPKRDANSNWEVAFFNSLQESQGVLILGGASSSLITGVTAGLLSKAVVAITAFGGSADKVWVLVREYKHVADVDIDAMGDPSWTTDSAKRLVASLSRQMERLDQLRTEARLTESRAAQRIQNRAIGAGVAFIIALFLVFLAFAAHNAALFALAFFGAPVLAGSAGGVTRLLLEVFKGTQTADSRGEAAALVLGMMAGALSSLLFVVAQTVTMDKVVNDAVAGTIDPSLRKLVVFEMIVAYVAGLTSEVVFAKLRSADVVDLSPVLSDRR